MAPELFVLIVHHLELQCRWHTEQAGIGLSGGNVFLDGLKVIKDEESPTVRSNDHCVVTLVKRDLIHSNSGKIRTQPPPVFSAIK